MSENAAPAEVGVTLTTTQAAAVLGMQPRRLRRYVSRGAVVGNRIMYAQHWRIATSEVERVAEALGIIPDWDQVTGLSASTSPTRERERVNT